MSNHHNKAFRPSLLINAFIVMPLLVWLDLFYSTHSPLWTGLLMTFAIGLWTSLFLHKYFSHCHFRMHRYIEAPVSFISASLFQFDPALWASVHRLHHKNSDTESDIHSPHSQPLWDALLFWSYRERAWVTDKKIVSDLLVKSDLRFYNNYPFVAPLIMSFLVYFGILTFKIVSNTNTPSSLPVWQTIDLYLNTFHVYLWYYPIPCYLMAILNGLVSTLVHLVGYQTYETKDHSRNNFILGLLFLGEGWHNNHHKYPHIANFGHQWWQIDLTYWALCVLRLLRIAR